ncbi:hypothetical protein [Nocardia donostiensis]|uniref:Mce-associated membrane protein n=1 Tax=Nocardia donostiensis TaxID=1538463 RepID=A0A1V2TI45_9NOCA|nr:hypothetical protein [Nocardia donostiensis]ONM49041.1 hypothetical protein B0T46_08865 [Nocardia donostiensis]OQS14058.1 hypothetical protein B0T36_16035 [Nocardia donostiensis]OQS19521.1 hypothetical protein B0T44_14190 [Nocardia donostiensis]
MSNKDAASEPKEPTGTGATDATAGGEPDDAASAERTTETSDTAGSERAAGEATTDETTAEPEADEGDEPTAKAKSSEVDEPTVKVASSAGDEPTVKVKPSEGAESTAKVEPAVGDEPTGKVQTDATQPQPGAVSLDKSDKSTSGAAKPAKPRSRSSLVLLGAVAAVLLVAALVAVGVFYFQADSRQEEVDRRAAATKAACDFGHNFATYRGDQMDDYLSRLDSTATGEWKKLVGELGPDLKKRFEQSRVTSSASEVQCGFESGSDDTARVVLIIDQLFTADESGSAPGQVKVAANVEMQKVDGRWLVAEFDTPMMQQ